MPCFFIHYFSAFVTQVVYTLTSHRLTVTNLLTYLLTSLLVAVWLIGNALVVINEVTLRRARLVLGWVTVCGRVNHLGM